MSKLKELQQRLERLPERRRLKALVGRMTAFQVAIAGAASNLNRAAHQEAVVREVFPGEWHEVVEPRRKKAARTATRLRKKFGENIDAVQEGRSNEAVSEVREQGEAARKGVRDSWKTLLQKKLTPYVRLERVAAKLGLVGRERLEAVLSRLAKAAETLPTRETEAAAVSADLQELLEAVKNLDLADEALGDWLVDAVDGKASLKKALDEKSIKDFLDRHKLWSLFQVATR